VPAKGLLTEAGEAVAALCADNAANVGLFIDVKMKVGFVERVEEAQKFSILNLMIESGLYLLTKVEFFWVAAVEGVFFEDMKESFLGKFADSLNV
jgi:hypothetical protein